MKQLRVGLNGFGRIGRAVARIAEDLDFLSIEAINTSKTNPNQLAYTLKYDSAYRTYDKDVVAEKDGITIDGRKITSYNERDPAKIPWEKHDIDVVIDATGVFKDREGLSKHIRGTVRKVILTVPSKDPKDSIPHVVLGVNDTDFDFKGSDIISNASCTTNCAAVMMDIMDKTFGLEVGYISTIHAYTSSQMVVDGAGKTETRGRAAALSIIPTTTGASKAVCKVTDLVNKNLGGISLRVPTPVGSLTDVTCVVKKKTTIEEINKTFKDLAEGDLKGVLKYEETPLVSSDYIGNPHSVTFDANYTDVINGTFVKIFGWYDNEWGYSARIVDIIERLSHVM